jgi:hypothetical protein
MRYITALLLLAASFLACRHLLDENPRDQVFVDNFFQTENDATAAVNSIYGILNATSSAPTFGGVYFSTYWVTMGLCSDEMDNRLPAVDLNELNSFTHKPVNASLYDFWVLAYKGINNANFAMEGIPNIQATDTYKNQRIGEARFLRAILYFDLTRWFGDVPLVIAQNSELRPPRAPKAQVYAQIIDDLTFAEQNLPESYSAGNGLGRATRGAASGMLAKVYLYNREWQKCLDQCNKVISSGKYGLYQDYAEAFRIPNENGKETLFGIGFGTANNSISFWEAGQFNVRLLPRELKGQISGVNAQGWQVATQALYDSYHPQDRRREVTLLTRINNQDGTTTTVEPHFQKYWD